MKLLYCKKCGDIFNLHYHTKTCNCNQSLGRCLDAYITESMQFLSDFSIPLFLVRYTISPSTKN